MIFRAKNGAEIIEKIAVSEEEALVRFPDINHALVVVKIEDDYLVDYWYNDSKRSYYGVVGLETI